MIVDGDVHGRHTGVQGGAVFVNAFQNVIHVARIGDQDPSASRDGARIHAAGHAVAVVQRNGDQRDVLCLNHIGPDDDLVGIDQDVLVRQISDRGSGTFQQPVDIRVYLFLIQEHGFNPNRTG